MLLGSSESETESFETCDSGNVSEEAMSVEVGGRGDGDKVDKAGNSARNFPNSKNGIKVQMRSIVSDIFDGQIESSVQCLSCKQ